MKAYGWALLAVVALVGVVFMPAMEYQADPMCIRCEVVNFINTGKIEVPAEVAKSQGETGQFFFENSKGKWYSKYGIFNDVMNLPPLLVERCVTGAPLPYFVDTSKSSARLLALNFFNILLAMASAAYLYCIAARYARAPVAAFVFVLAALYCTYWWNYLRAQNSEIYQALFTLGFYYHLTTPFHGAARKVGRDLLLAGAFLGMLILVKAIYVVLIPLAVIWYGWFRVRSSVASGPAIVAVLRELACMAAPVALAFGALLAVNAYKFGSPFDTGYEQWGEYHHPVFSGNFLTGAWQLLFSAHGSILLHFPIVLPALLAFPWFLRRFPADFALLLAIGVLLFVVNAKMRGFLGGWGYGPRYLLVTLPLLSLPFVLVIEYVRENWRKGWVLGGSIVLVLVLGYSLDLQMNVNALPFFINCQLEECFAPLHMPEVDDYFISRPFGVVNAELLAHQKGAPWPLLQQVAPRIGPQNVAFVDNYILTSSNYYWWRATRR
ncbi:MAG TPA: hypothetical protein VHY09_10925 [Candidatus Methylacidiphilales bacterium]|jgi:hypothetical protein|nr:hypothetical protein [Candidatus Methylacidiphilales bacterium]